MKTIIHVPLFFNWRSNSWDAQKPMLRALSEIWRISLVDIVCFPENPARPVRSAQILGLTKYVSVE